MITRHLERAAALSSEAATIETYQAELEGRALTTGRLAWGDGDDALELLVLLCPDYPTVPPVVLLTISGGDTQPLPLEWDLSVPADERLTAAIRKGFTRAIEAAAGGASSESAPQSVPQGPPPPTRDAAAAQADGQALAQHEAELGRRQEELDRQRSDLLGRERTVAGQEAGCTATVVELKAARREVDAQKRELQQREAELTGSRTILDQRAKELELRQKALDQKTEELTRQRTTLEQEALRVTQQQQRLAALMADPNALLAHLDTELSRVGASLEQSRERYLEAAQELARRQESYDLHLQADEIVCQALPSAAAPAQLVREVQSLLDRLDLALTKAQRANEACSSLRQVTFTAGEQA